MARILKGAPAATAMTEQMALECEKMKSEGVAPKLAILRVGEKPEDLSYERGAKKRMEKVGIEVETVQTTDGRLLDELKRLNEDTSVSGILCLRPLADKQVEEAATHLIDPRKDIDGMSPTSFAHVFSGAGDGFCPCTAQGVLELLKFYDVPLKGKNVVVLGRSLVIGKPVAMLMLAENATVTVCHSKTENLKEICRRADILIAAIGKAKFVDADYVSAGQTVIDVGINVDADGNLCGDTDFDAILPIVDACTPTPGGTGALTTAVLARHVLSAAASQHKDLKNNL